MATNCCSSSPWHPQPRYQLQCVLGLTLALGRRTCTERHWTSAPFGLCVCLGGVRVRQRNSISISSKHGCFQLQRLLIQLVASTQAAAVTYFPSSELGKVCMRNQEQQFSLTEKVWKTKHFASGREGCSVPGLAFWSTHLHSVCCPHLSQVYPFSKPLASSLHPPFSYPWFSRKGHGSCTHTLCSLELNV